MHQEADRSRLFARRALLLGGAQSAIFGVLGYRLHHLQIERREDFELLAEDNRVSHQLVVPPRGRIFDRFGRPLARNIPIYRVTVTREDAGDVHAALERLAGVIPLDEAQIEAVLARSRAHRPFVPIAVREDLSWDEVTRIAIRAPELPGIVLESSLVRDYPHPVACAHVLGYVGPVNRDEQAADPDPLMRQPGFQIGKSGIEAAYDKALRGSAGQRRIEVNAVGRQIRDLAAVAGAPGEDIHLALDLDLQRFCFERLSNELAASAVLVDVQSGAVRALASVPSYDPRPFAVGLSRAQWLEWRDNPRTPLVNKSIRGEYPPGSTFKMVTALAALEAGISAQYESFCPGFMALGSARFHCWKEHGHGRVALTQALAQSCDVYFYDVARKVGVDAIAAMARKLGLGAPTGIDLPGERPGLIPTSQWKKEALGESWQKGETLVVGIGQGFVSATPLQIALMTARLCNGGRAVVPSFAIPPEQAPPPASIEISQSSLKAVLYGMREVVHGPRGTARQAALDLPGIEMGGKTGTSQVRRISKAERAAGLHKRKDKPWEHRHHALFTCFAPYDAPRYALAVIVEHGNSGSKAAAPIAKDIMTKALQLDEARGATLAGL